MSEENPQTWHRRVWALAAPIIVSNITVPLLGAVDTAVVGHLESAVYLGAVAVGAMIFNFLYWGFAFLRMGTTGFAAQAEGAGDAAEVVATLARGLVIAFALAAIIVAAQGPIMALAAGLVGASPAVEANARTYFFVRVWGAPAALAFNVLLGWFLGLHNARACLLLQVVMNGLNIVLDVVFVVGLGMAVAGVALATVIAEYAGVAVALVLAVRTLKTLAAWPRWAQVLAPHRLRRMLAVNRDIFVRTLCLILAFAYLTARGARMGDVVLAANAIMMTMLTFVSYGLDGFANAAQALVGRAIGAADRAAFAGVVRASTAWAAATALAFALAYAGLGPLIIDTLTSVPAVRAAAREVLPWMVVIPLVAVWSYQLDGIFFGATRGPELRNAMVLSLAAYAAAMWAFADGLGNHGLWLAFTIFMAARGLTLAWYYPRIPRALAAAGD